MKAAIVEGAAFAESGAGFGRAGSEVATATGDLLSGGRPGRVSGGLGGASWGEVVCREFPDIPVGVVESKGIGLFGGDGKGRFASRRVVRKGSGIIAKVPECGGSRAGGVLPFGLGRESVGGLLYLLGSGTGCEGSSGYEAVSSAKGVCEGGAEFFRRAGGASGCFDVGLTEGGSEFTGEDGEGEEIENEQADGLHDCVSHCGRL